MLGRSVIKSIGAGLTTVALVLGIQMIKAEAAVERSCVPRQVGVDGLIKKFQGKRQAADLVSGKAVMEVFVSHKGSDGCAQGIAATSLC